MSYAHKIDKCEAAIDWRLPAAQIERRVRAFDPFPGASFALDGELLKLWRAEPVPGAGRPGEVLRADGVALVIATGDGALALHTLQRPGGRRIGAADLLRARPVPTGLMLASVAAD